MDERRQAAYRYLLYHAMLDIRRIGWQRWTLNPWRCSYYRTEIKFAGELADALHNLALFAATSFDRFDEERFWKEMSRLAKLFPNRRVERYQEMFKDRVDHVYIKANELRAAVTSFLLATSVQCDDNYLNVELIDGRIIRTPLARFPRLYSATAAQRDKLEIVSGGRALYWPEIDEDISIAGLLAGADNQSA